MYTTQIVENVEAVPMGERQRRRFLTVRFIGNGKDFTHSFVFALYTPKDQIRRVIREFIQELDASDIITPDLTVGPLDLTDIDLTVPQETQELMAFFKKKGKLDKLNEIKNLGFLTGAKATALDTAISDLKAQMHTDFKQAFVNYF